MPMHREMPSYRLRKNPSASLVDVLASKKNTLCYLVGEFSMLLSNLTFNFDSGTPFLN